MKTRAKILALSIVIVLALTAVTALADKNYKSSLSNTSTVARINENVGNILIRYGIVETEINRVTGALAEGISEDELKTLLTEAGVNEAGAEEVLAELDRMGAEDRVSSAQAEDLPNAGLTPESPFYFLDKLGEALRDFLTFNPEAKARLQVAYAGERVAEIKIILETKGVDAKGLEVAQARLEANATKAADIVEKEKQKGKDVSKLAGEIVDNFHIQRKAAKQAFDDAKEEFKTKKRALHNQLLAAIEAGDTVLQEQIKARLVQIEAAKDEADAKKDATIDALEKEKDRLRDELEEQKRQEDKARDAAERAEDRRKEAEEHRTEQEEKARETQIEAAERVQEAREKEAERVQEQLKKEQEQEAGKELKEKESDEAEDGGQAQFRELEKEITEAKRRGLNFAKEHEERISKDLTNLENQGYDPGEIKRLRQIVFDLSSHLWPSPAKQEKKEEQEQEEQQTSSCENTAPVLTADFTDFGKVRTITAPGSPSSEGPKGHSFVWTDHQRVSVYAPADITFDSGSYSKDTTDSPAQYLLFFDVKGYCDFKIKFDHIDEPVDSIKANFPPTPAVADSRTISATDRVEMKAGGLVGYTSGTPQAGNWDFGLYDMSQKGALAESYGAHAYSVCWVDFYAPEKQAQYRNLLEGPKLVCSF